MLPTIYMMVAKNQDAPVIENVFRIVKWRGATIMMVKGQDGLRRKRKKRNLADDGPIVKVTGIVLPQHASAAMPQRQVPVKRKPSEPVPAAALHLWPIRLPLEKDLKREPRRLPEANLRMVV